MSDVIKVAAAGIVAAICAVMLGKQAPEMAMVLAACAGALILLYCSSALSAVTDFMDELTEKSGLAQGVVAPVLKITGISVITRISADFCRDAKEGTLATVVEMAGSVIALVTVIPLMSRVLELISGLL